VVVVLVSILAHGCTPARLRRLRDQLGGSLGVQTIGRWRTWWQQAFLRSPFWTQERGRFAPPVARTRLPATLLARFQGPTLGVRMRRLLAFLAPLTVAGAGSLQPG
jgi:hypothetical protein